MKMENQGMKLQLTHNHLKQNCLLNVLYLVLEKTKFKLIHTIWILYYDL